MHILVTDPSRVPGSRYRRFVQRAQLLGLQADQFVGGEPYLALNAVVLDADDVELLRRLTTTFSTAFHAAGQALAGQVPTLVDMGFPWVAAELLSAELPRVPLVGRFDFVRDEAGHWWLLELNADTPSGIREAVVADLLVHRFLPEARWLTRPNDGLCAELQTAFDSAVAGLSAGQALGLVTSAGEVEDMAQMAFTQRALCAPVHTRGIEVILGDLDNLRATNSGLNLCGRRVDALYRYVPFESMLGRPAFAAIFEAVARGQLALLNGLYGLLLQHKGVLAWLWEHRDDPGLDDEVRGAIRAHLPPTWLINDSPPHVPQSSLVAKQVFGREGEEVYFGEDLTTGAWQMLRRARTYVAQRRVPVAELSAVVPTSTGALSQRGYLTVGCYAVDGAWAGFYTRCGGRITTARAKWLATFVE